MKPPQRPWPLNAAFQDVLFVGQLIDQLVSEESFESFRAPCLDPITLIDEAIELCNQVLLGRVPAETLRPITQELFEALERDAAISRLSSSRVELVLPITKNPQKVDTAKLKAGLRYLRSAVAVNY